ncbi:MAG: hypothetical protein H6825_03205 [Planctomycetes bacterium]|nr:hypothetical protein [Planctomycetota bacterium]
MLATFALWIALQQDTVDPCAELRAKVAETYGFVPHALEGAERKAAATAMDAFWTWARAQGDPIVPCLTEALSADDADPWFRFDGTGLLLEMAPTEASKTLAARLLCEVDLADVDPAEWLRQLLWLGGGDFDVTRAAERWIAAERTAFVPEHFLTLGPIEGALLLYGCMDESRATPSLARLAADPGHPAREMAIALLTLQATPESWRALGALDLQTLPAELRESVESLCRDGPQRPDGEPQVHASREELRAALRAQRDGRFVDGEPLSPRDFVLNALRELRAEDVELLRAARRRRATHLSDETFYDYQQDTFMIQVLTWSEEFFAK